MIKSKTAVRKRAQTLIGALFFLWATFLYSFGIDQFNLLVGTLLIGGIYFHLANKGMKEHIFLRRYLRKNFLKYTIPFLLKAEAKIDTLMKEQIEKTKANPTVIKYGLKLEKLIKNLKKRKDTLTKALEKK